MINNRQGSRRRGRGGSSQQRSPSASSGQRDSGNRIDSRARGNAAQLLEKYKNMARDAQMSGDRVQVEYYLQFADHYFRVLSDSRARSDDHRPIRPVDDFDGSDEEYGDEGEPIRANEQGDGRQQPYQPNGRDAQQPYQQNARDSQQPYQQNARESQPPRRDDARRDDGRRDDARREESRREDPRRDDPRRDDRQRRDHQPRDDVRADQAAHDDQPMLQANGHDYRERVANDLDEPAAATEAKSATTRRSSRTRAKPAPLAAEGLDADRLPPSLGAAARIEESVDVAEVPNEGEPKPKRRRRASSTEVQAG